jgi:hypothetical protein
MQAEFTFENKAPIVGSKDPVTSALAARELEESGARDSQKREVYFAVKQYPDRTSAELAVITGMDRYMLARRLPDLREDGWVENSGKKVCLMTGGLAFTWRICR